MRSSQPLVVGVTGGIGSGKTTIVRAFESLGIPAYIADERAKELMNSDKALIDKITSNFGDKAYKNGMLNPAYLAEIVFADRTALEKLNNLVHPVVRNDFKSWLGRQTSKFVVYESALIIELAQEAQFDYIILVTAPLEQRIERVVKRNNTSKEDVLKRIKNQMPDEEKAKKADFIINNLDNTDFSKKISSIYAKIVNNI